MQNCKSLWLIFSIFLVVLAVYVAAKTDDEKTTTTVAATTTRTPTTTTAKSVVELMIHNGKRRKWEIIGNYTLVSDPKEKDYHQYLQAMEFKEEDIEKIRNSSNVIVSLTKNESLWTITHTTKNKTLILTFESGKEFVGELMDGRKVNNTITIDEKENRLNRNITLSSNCLSKNEVRFSRKGFKIAYKVKNITAKQEFKRINAEPKANGGFFEAMKNISEAIRHQFLNKKSNNNDSSEEDNKGWTGFRLLG